ncbi:MAG: hypothetical protein DA330_07495 [Nitrososphaera sp.]|nr:hypothetical protein [Nitrososphaera sp.]
MRPSSLGKIDFLYDCDEVERQKILYMLEVAGQMVIDYFGKKCNFDVLVCDGGWCMEVQTISRERGQTARTHSTKFLAFTDYNLNEIVIRKDSAKFVHYLHEMIHCVIPKKYPNQLREGLAWFFTLQLIKPYPYLRPNYPMWIAEIYINPVKSLVGKFGVDFIKDFAVGTASIEESALPEDAKDLFLPEEVFFRKKDQAS